MLSGSPKLLITGAVDALPVSPDFYRDFAFFRGPAASVGIPVTAIGSEDFPHQRRKN